MNGGGAAHVVGVLTSPTRTFQTLRQRPTWIVAFLVLLVTTAGVGHLAQSKVDSEAMIRDLMERAPGGADPARMEALIERQESQSPLLELAASTAFLAVVPLLCALYFWMGTRLFGGEPTFGQSFSTVVHALVPWWALKAVLSLPALLARDELTLAETTCGVLPSNPGFFLGEEASILLRGLAASLDLFTLWGLALLCVGFAIVAGVSRAASGALTFFVWLLVLGMTLLPMLLPQLLGA